MQLKLCSFACISCIFFKDFFFEILVLTFFLFPLLKVLSNQKLYCISLKNLNYVKRKLKQIVIHEIMQEIVYLQLRPVHNSHPIFIYSFFISLLLIFYYHCNPLPLPLVGKQLSDLIGWNCAGGNGGRGSCGRGNCGRVETERFPHKTTFGLNKNH